MNRTHSSGRNEPSLIGLSAKCMTVRLIYKLGLTGLPPPPPDFWGFTTVIIGFLTTRGSYYLGSILGSLVSQTPLLAMFLDCLERSFPPGNRSHYSPVQRSTRRSSGSQARFLAGGASPRQKRVEAEPGCQEWETGRVWCLVLIDLHSYRLFFC